VHESATVFATQERFLPDVFFLILTTLDRKPQEKNQKIGRKTEKSGGVWGLTRMARLKIPLG
jgi:hypothetical protein